MAGAIAFALPEHFGGLVPVCATGDFREEDWLKHRMIDRLSSLGHLRREGAVGELEARLLDAAFTGRL